LLPLILWAAIVLFIIGRFLPLLRAFRFFLTDFVLRWLRVFLHDLSFSELAKGHFLSTRIFLGGFGIVRVIILGGLGEQGLEFVTRLGLLGFGFRYD
jgi:hypothetical protein